MLDTIKISDVRILPRQRKELTTEEYVQHIAELAESIEKFGLLQPIVIAKDNSLVAGFSRIQAFLKLGRTEIPFRRVETLDPIELKEMELEENVRRKNLSWFEEAAAIAEIHALKKERDPSWNMMKTAEAVGRSLGTVSQSISIVEESREDPSLKEEKGLVSALNKLKYKRAIKERMAKVAAFESGAASIPEAEILVGPAEELILLEKDESYDAVITSFPFGVSLEFRGGEVPYEDEELKIIRLVQTIVKESYRVLKPNSWMVAFFDIRKITYSNLQREVYETLMRDELYSFVLSEEMKQTLFDSMGLAFWMESAGFDYVQVIPCAWVKPNKVVGIVGDPNKGLLSAWEAFILAGKGSPVLTMRGLRNIFIYNNPQPSEQVHDVQMPVDLCTDLVKLVCLGGSRILDPFAGSGSVGIGALEAECSFRGYEINPNYAALGNMRLKEYLLERYKKEA